MYTHHKLDHEFEHGADASVMFVVCAVPRSGSSLLCELLCLTGLAGAPTEFFDPELMAKFREAWAVRTLDEYVQALVAKKTTPNGVFGFKAHYHQLANAFREADMSAHFPDLRYIYITRDDRIRQAVSYAKAVQTGQWASEHAVTQGREPVFKKDQIDRLLDRVRGQEERWEGLFERRGIRPLRLVYEELVESPDRTVLRVLEFIGVEPPQPFLLRRPTLSKQADQESEEWVRRYVESRGGLVKTGARERGE